MFGAVEGRLLIKGGEGIFVMFEHIYEEEVDLM